MHGRCHTSTGHCCSTLLEALHFRHPDSSGAGIRFRECHSADPVCVAVEVSRHRSYALVNFHCRCSFEYFPSSRDVDVVVAAAVAMLIWLCSCATTSDENHPWRTRKTTEQEVVVRACEAVVVAVAQGRAAVVVVVAAVARATSECDCR